MRNFNHHFSPFPPNYIAITFRPADELWICQGPSIFIELLRSFLNHVWPKYDYHERHCDVPERRRCKGDTKPRSMLKNTVFRIPMNPFNLSSIHQSEDMAEAAYRFVTLMVALLYSMNYEMVAAGHFIRGTEASTCIFRCESAHAQLKNLDVCMEDCQLRCPKVSAKNSKAFEFEYAKRMLVIGLEGWNRLYCISITHKLISKLTNELRMIWPESVIFHKIRPLDTNECKNTSKKPTNEVDTDEPSSYLIEFEGHPWDSYKDHSDLTPYLIMSLIRVLDQEGFSFVSRANVRGLLDTLFFIKHDSPSRATNATVLICISLCHQNTFRIYGGTSKFCSWMSQLLQQLWLFGVASEQEISSSQTGSSKRNSNTKDNLHFTEIKLNGTPFCIPEWNKDNFFAAQYMISRLLGVLSLVGWRLKASLNVYSSPYDKSLLVFEKDAGNCEEDKLLNLEVVEFEVKPNAEENEENIKTFDLLRPVCLTSYDIDRLCILGGSQHFLLGLNERFPRLFDTSQTNDGFPFRCKCMTKSSKEKNHSTEFQDKNSVISDNWITSRLPYAPELLHKIFLSSDHSTICLLSPLYDNLALTAIAELDPSNVLEYMTNYKMWAANSCWPPKMFRKTNSRARKFFHRSQIPLAVLCWINEFINTLECPKRATSSVNQDGEQDHNEIVEVATASQTMKHVLNEPYARTLVTCLDCASTARNSPPAWIYLIKECNQRVIIEDKLVQR